jgi:glycosyltransferase involved in cell wall biosynthesis
MKAPSTELAPEDASHTLSLVVPLYNEEENVIPLVESVRAALQDVPWPWQLILVDDGSRDGTRKHLQDVAERFPDQVCAVLLRRNFGQTAAMQAGIDTATGSIIVTLDGDLQNNPQDIPRMVRRLLDEDLDLLAGWRQKRKDNVWLRKVPSWIANRLIGRITGITLHDYGCSLKVFRAAVIKEVRLYGEMHRFIPTWLATQTSPDRIKEEPVSHFPRLHGQSKYGLSRTFRVVLDLIAVYFFMRFRARPGHFFGWIGMLCSLIGGGALGYLAFVKIFLSQDIGDRPLLLLGALLVLAGVQFICTGIVTEMLMRTYYESSNSKIYLIQKVLGASQSDQRMAPATADERSTQ